MGLFEESTWGAEKSGKNLVKRLSQKRKQTEQKRKANILSSNTDAKKKNKKKKIKNQVDIHTLNETQGNESSQNVQKVQNSKKKSKKNKISISSILKNSKTESNFLKAPKKPKSKKKHKINNKNTESLKQKSIQDQEINPQLSKLKKRKRPKFEEEAEQVTKSKKRKLKAESTIIKNQQIEKSENNISEGTSLSKSKKKRNKKKKQKGKILIEGNLKSPQAPKDKLLKKINVNKIQDMLINKKQEIKERKLNSSSLRERMLAHLRSSRFRFINESFYNSASTESNQYFKDDPDAFVAYHEGYRQQVSHWPLNPVDVIIASINKMSKDHIVADFGCGEAKLADSVPQTVHSLDLVALNDKVKACDMAHTPLLTNSVNVVVFCLSLMGTNLADYLLEANRVLKTGGILKIAEVESRFDSIENFINLVASYGFVNIWMDLSNDLFYFLDFKKEKDIAKGKKNLPEIELKPCLYKKR